MIDQDDLPGMLALRIGIESGAFPYSMDARIWAKEWVETVKNKPEIAHDEATMISWFANAIMAGYDTAQLRIGERTANP